MKRLLVSGAGDPLWGAALEPSDRPVDVLPPIDLDGAVRAAMSGRTDLAEARRQAAANQATLAFLRDQARPQVDLVGTYALAGVGGARLVRAGNDPLAAFSGPAVATIPGGYGNALTALGDYPTWGVSLNLTYPIGGGAARAEAARAMVQMKQVDAQIRQLEVQVITEVTDAAIGVRNDFDALASARLARDLAGQQVAAEQKKFAEGLSTNYFVVQAQKDLAQAANAELQAEVAYRKALVAFDRVQHATLQAAGVTIVSPAGLATPVVGSGRPAAPAPSASIFQ